MRMRLSGWSTRTTLLPLVVLGVTLALAWMISAHEGGWLLAPVRWLAEYEAFHLIAHWVIFGGIAWMTRSQGHLRRWSFVLIGGVLLELAQALGRGHLLNVWTLRASLFDLGIDCLGALTLPPAVRRAVALLRLI